MKGKSPALRKIFLLNLSGELLSTVLRQIFDFLGYLWLPMALNFLNILCVILGLFGLLEERLNYLIIYILWTFLWISWNIFLICFYQNLGFLNHRSMDILGLGTGSLSWWSSHGLGCEPQYLFSSEKEASSFLPSSVEGCSIHYEDLEAALSALQVLFGLLGLTLGSLRLGSRTPDQGNKSMYSIEAAKEPVTTSNTNTPRRVKRKSRASNKRSINPVNRLMLPNNESLYGAMIGPRCPSSYSNFHQGRNTVPHKVQVEEDEFPLPPPPAILDNFDYTESQTLYAGSNNESTTIREEENPSVYGAIPKRTVI